MTSQTPSPSSDSMGRAALPSVSSSFSPGLDLDVFSDSVYSSPGSAHLSPASPVDMTRDVRKDVDINSTRPSDLDPASGPQRTRSSHSNNAAGPSEIKEKRKRSRVTPEQLAHLERLFATDRSPTAARRREISEMLGMQERQTQIWFQNRRAKAKLQESRKEHTDQPPELPPPLVAGSDAELYYLVHEDEPISVIPCIELSVGTWKRVVSGPGKLDLVAYSCDTQKRLTWYIHSAGQGFKMEIPFSSVVDTKFISTGAPGMGQASFMLSQPPTFYHENIVAAPDPVLGTTTVRTWKRCNDWTEGLQASVVLQHDLVGAALQLAHVLRSISTYTAGPSIPLYPPTYHATSHVSPPDPSSSPMAGIAEPNRDGASHMSPFGFVDYSLKRRFSTPALIQSHSIRHFPTNAIPPGYVSPSGDASMSPSPTYSDLSSLSAGSPGPTRHRAHYSSSSSEDFPRLAISQSISRRSFAGPSTSYSEFRQSLPGTYGGGPPLPPTHPLVALQQLRRSSSASWEQPLGNVVATGFVASDIPVGIASSLASTRPYPPSTGTDYEH